MKPTKMRALRDACDDHLTDKNTVHSYLEAYEALFSPRRESARDVLELGVNHGGSIAMWQRFFPNATVTGVDISMQNVRANLSDPRVRLVNADAYTHETTRALGDRAYDIIIDDGPHTLESMLFVAAHYSALLAPGGVLVIEDIQSMDWVGPITAAFPEHLRQNVSVVDRRSVKGRYDDVLDVLDLAPPVSTSESIVRAGRACI